MQGKGLVISFAIALAVLSVYYLSFTWYTRSIEEKANREVVYKMDSIEKKNPNLTVAEQESYENEFNRKALDQLSKDTLNLGFVKYTYETAKDKEIALGLDLKGGMNVILQVSVKDLLEDLSDHSTNPQFKEVLEKTDVAQRSSNRDYLDDFFIQYNDLKKTNASLRLASPEWFGTRKNSEKIGINTTDDEAEKIIREYVEAKVSTAYQVIRARIDQFGVTQPVVQQVGEKGSGRILVELPGIKDTDRVKKLLQSTAKLEFWEAVRLDENIHNYFVSLSQKLEAAQIENGKDSLQSVRNSLISKMAPAGESNSIYYVKVQDTAAVNKALKNPIAKTLLPASMRYFRFLWGNKATETAAKEYILPLYAIRGNAKNLPLLDGGVVTEARAERQTQTFANNVAVSMQMNSKGSQEWFEITKKFKGQPIAVVLDDLVYTAPNINEPISGGRSQITGHFTMNEAKDLASVLAAGSLPASAKIIQVDVVGPSLGKESIHNGLVSFAIALLVVFIYMIFFYNGAGFISVIGLLANILFLMGILVSFGAVLTLPGIAGIVLTMGMAVDANVIIYERVKEELSKGKGLKQALGDAYTWKGAYSAIIDANLTTLITAIVLFFFGDGPIKGFAVTLIIGVFTTLFTSVLLCKYFIYRRVDNGKSITFGNKMTINFLKNVNIDFFKFKKGAFILSSVLIIASIVSLATRGLNLGIEFQNGREYKVRFDKQVKANEIAADLAKVFVDENGTKYSPNVVTIGNANQVKVTTKYKSNDDSQAVDVEVEKKLYEGLKQHFPNLSFDRFVNVGAGKGGALGIVEYRKVGPSIADDITYNSFYSVAIALSLVFLYLLLTFRKWQFSAGAVLATLHDTIIVLGLFSIFYGILPFSLEVDVAFIAAILTVIGYSLNDTVIVFDRVREFMGDFKNMPIKDVINKAVNTTLTRTLNTSLTTLFVILVIFMFGGESIRSFMFALLVGVGVGTYSSVFVASFLLYQFSNKRKVENKK
ncbi:protein translocase subunit SecD [Ornithobacterium rhinotracheale]|uniref:Multifunctional fusion protein n=1 Tax=Ornithobacterium rhinotracheale TaxID=28251 RepID=A0A3R5X090_ORNRH|nr:protein translocase subunit SecD [Ornithobacterium rhinotracheale]QAR31322.1 protein translocase subunit SecD [Ornithobacterium rhinotracheale]